MIETIKKETSAKVTVLLFLFFSIWWLYIQFYDPSTSFSHQLFAACYGVIALWGGLWGLIISRKWGGMGSLMGRAITMFALGLFLQEFGQLVYSYYIYFQHIDVPYPSIGDIGYFGSVLAYIYGVFLLGKASGTTFALKSVRNKIQVILIPLGMLVLGYSLFLKDYSFDWSQPLTIFLDFGYPLGQAIYISLALLAYLLSRKYLGGMMKQKILYILFALLVQFLSDYTFLYQASKDQWYAGGVNDFMYLCSYFIMTLSLIQLNTVWMKLRHS